jgi:hypothetical protein
MVRYGNQQGLLSRGAPPQGRTSDAVMIEVDVTTYQAMKPRVAHGKALTQYIHLPALIGAPHVDELPTQRRIRVKLKALGQCPACWSCFGKRLSAGTVRSDVLVGAHLQFVDIGHAITLPHLRLP